MNTMNRCLPLSPVRFLTALLAVLVWATVFPADPAAAQYLPRQFPPAALRGTLQVTAPPEVLLNGKSARLAPGARIKGVNNLMVMSGALMGSTVLVNYMRDTQGLIQEVWILNPQEAQEKRAGAGTVTNIVFASDADQSQAPKQ
jgi:hypothetical protein